MYSILFEQIASKDTVLNLLLNIMLSFLPSTISLLSAIQTGIYIY